MSMRTVFDYKREVRLVGGYICHLKPDEANAWHVYITAQPEFIELRLAFAVLDAATRQQGVEESALAKLVARHDAAEMRLFELGKAWYAKLEEKRWSELGERGR